MHIHAQRIRGGSDEGTMQRKRLVRIRTTATVTRAALPTLPLVGSKSIQPAPGSRPAPTHEWRHEPG